MSEELLDIPEFIRDANKLAIKRENLRDKNPKCKRCGTHQIQLIGVTNQEWKCRNCNYIFTTNYKI